MARRIYQSQKDVDREKFVQAVLHSKYSLELTSSLCPYDFIGSWPAVSDLGGAAKGATRDTTYGYNAIFELKARTYKMDEVPDGLLYLTFDKYQKIVDTHIPHKKLLIMNPEGLWIGDFNDILKDIEDYPETGPRTYPRVIIGGRYDRNDSGDVGLHVLFPVNKLTNIYNREELIRLQHEYTQSKQILSAEEIQRILTSTN